MRFLSSSVICFAMSAFLSLRLPSSPDRARGRQEVVGAHDTEQPGFAEVNAPSFPREGYGVCHHSPSLCLTLLCLLLIAEVTTPNRVRLLPQSTPKTFFNFFSKPPCAPPDNMIHLRQFKDQTRHMKRLRRFANPDKPRVRLRETKQRRERKRKRDSDIRGQRRSPEIEPRPRPKESMLYFLTLRPRAKFGEKREGERPREPPRKGNEK